MEEETDSAKTLINVKELPALDVSTSEFMGVIAGEDAKVVIQAWYDPAPKEKKVLTFNIPVKDFDALVESENLSTIHRRSYGVHWKPNLGGMAEADVKTITCQYVECDDLPMDEQWVALMDAPIKPTAVVRTRKSLHAYYKVNQATSSITLNEIVQTQLVEYFQGDKSRTKANASCRLPGFYHCKQEPLHVDIIYWEPSNIYEQKDIADAFPPVKMPIKEEHLSKGEAEKHSGIQNMLDSCAFFSFCKGHQHLFYSLWFYMINILTFLKGGRQAAHDYSKHDARYTPEETNKVFDGCVKDSPGPTLCSTLEKYGFKCPKKENGTCLCKSPILLALRPPEYNLLHDKIKAIERIPGTDNLPMAKKFVAEHLYNVNRNSAKLLIKELCDVLKLTDIDKVTLNEAQKAALETFEKTANGYASKYERGLGPWYVINGRSAKFAPLILALYLKKNFHAFFLNGDFYVYEDGVYVRKSKDAAYSIITDHLDPSSATAKEREDAYNFWTTEAAVDENEVDSDPNIINLENGLYNVETETLNPHTYKYFSTIRIHASYDPNATAPVFEQFLASCLDDQAQQHLMLQIIGYCLMKLNCAQKMFILLGPGATGKSSMLNVIEGLVGEENISNVQLQDLEREFALANLLGKMVNISGDLPAMKFSETSAIKTIVGNDTNNINRKFRDGINVKLHTRLIASCNTIPPAYCDQSSGWYRRMLIMDFKNVVPEGQRDTRLNERLDAERNGILLLALKALKTLREDTEEHKPYTFATTELNELALRTYRRDSNSAIAFAEDCLEIGEGYYTTNADLQQAYDNYCMEEGIEGKMALKTVTKRLSEWNQCIKRGAKIKGQRVITGVRLKDQEA